MTTWELADLLKSQPNAVVAMSFHSDLCEIQTDQVSKLRCIRHHNKKEIILEVQARWGCLLCPTITRLEHTKCPRCIVGHMVKLPEEDDAFDVVRIGY